MEIVDGDETAALRAALQDTRSRFLAAVDELRPRLHRYCARMCGSALDGEDVVQETLAQAFYSLPALEDAARLEPWLFRIAHHKCVDFLRRERRTREATVPYDDQYDRDAEPYDAPSTDAPVDEALAALVGTLPPRERSAVLLKDVLDYRLAEIAEMVDSTVGGVKAALHRGRTRLHALRADGAPGPARPPLDGTRRRLLEAYADCFNRRDWDALRLLIQDDARLEVVGVAEGSVSSATYFGNYTRLPWEWRFSVATVDGEPVLVHWRREGEAWRATTAIRLWWADGRVVRIRDYVHVDYLLRFARMEEDGSGP
jgi:RNA polymerase sigma-70 factor, ECF subfamily